MTDAGQLEDDFLGHLWPPFTQMQGLKPVIIERAEGAVVYDAEGNAYIDAFATLWTVNVGHGPQGDLRRHRRAGRGARHATTCSASPTRPRSSWRRRSPSTCPAT